MGVCGSDFDDECGMLSATISFGEEHIRENHIRDDSNNILTSSRRARSAFSHIMRTAENNAKRCGGYMASCSSLKSNPVLIGVVSPNSEP
jgi:hypothetical protein